MSNQPTMLCILDAEQRTEYAAELENLTGRGVRLIYQESGEAALEQLGEFQPRAVMVGMEVGPLEGLEFLALLMARYPNFELPVVVLPRKTDPFPPVCHRRDPQSGHSSADEITLGQLAALVSLSGDSAVPEGRMAMPGAGPLRVVPTAATLLPSQVEPFSSPQPKRWVLFAIVGVVLVLGGGLTAVLLSGEKREERPPIDALTPALPAQPKPKALPPAAVPRQPVATHASDKAAPTGDDKAAPTASEKAASAASEKAASAAAPTFDLSKPLVLPLRFDKGTAQATVANNGQLNELVAFLRAKNSLRLEVVGHASTEGDVRFNEQLGAQRARAAVELLVARGLARSRLTVKSVGGTQPMASNDTEEGRAKNRRVTVQARQ